MAKSMNLPQVFICEDEFRCVDPARFKNSLSKFEAENSGNKHGGDSTPEKRIGKWDVLLLGGNNIPPYTTIAGVDCCVCVGNCQTTVGYIVRAHAYEALIRNFREGADQLIRHPDRPDEFAVGVYWKRLQAKGTWFLLVPLTITRQTGPRGVEPQGVNYDRNMLDLDKDWLLSPMYANREKKTPAAVSN